MEKMKIKQELETKHSDFTIERNEEKFEVDFKNFKREFNTDVKCYKTIKSEPLEINIKGKPISTNNTNGSTIWSPFGYKIERDIKKEEVKENYDVKRGVKSEFEEEEQIQEHDIQLNSEKQKHLKYNIKTKKYIPSRRKCNKIHDKIKRKYFRVMFASHSKQELTCDLCKQTFRNKRILQTHLFCHIRKKPFRCTTCNKKFLWQFLLRRHMKEHKSGNENEISQRNLCLQPSGDRVKSSPRNGKVHACKICGKEFKCEFKLLRHEATHSKDLPFKCDICNKGFKWKSQLNIIKKLIVKNILSNAIFVIRVLNGEATLKYHEKTHSDERPFKCDICNKGFNLRGQLKSHQKTHIEERPFKCDICNKGFKWRYQLKSHQKTHSEEQPFKCDICNKGFKWRGQLKSHQKTHSEERPFKCDICNKGFKWRYQLKSHQKTHSEEQPFKCDICNKGFKWRGQLKSHQKTHSEERPFKCDICNKGFKWRYQLKSHQKTHSEEQPFKCDICQLKSHHKTHSEERPFKCDICNKSFKWRRQLKSHQKTHSEERPFNHQKTHSEERPFNAIFVIRVLNEEQLKTHQKTHSEERPFKCDICNKGFKWKGLLKASKNS
ncbi:oocyte zinc finger protein XlCOF6-like [Centruroides vittatus]|uniref:oocyte zinc finger protein XlCOF6-like n=1 Tax=Centruroides vittatus TaxID=120091 RepID=UPI00350EE013